MRGGDRLARGGGHAEGIEQEQMVGRVGEADLFVLALHLDKQRAEVFQEIQADLLVVDQRAGTAVTRDDAPEQDFALRIQPLFGQQVHGGVAGGDGKGRRYDRLRGAGADQPGVGTRPKGKAEAVQQYGFTGTRLTGERGEAGGEMQIQPLDQHDVADR